jgi:hypothetical protein
LAGEDYQNLPDEVLGTGSQQWEPVYFKGYKMKKNIKEMSTDELAKMIANAVVKLHNPPGVPPRPQRKKRKRIYRKGKMITI